MVARMVTVVAIVAVLVTACGERRAVETRPPASTTTPRPTALSLPDLIRSGRLRVAFNTLNITCTNTTPGGVVGLCMDVARELAAQMRVTLVETGYNSGPLLMDGGRAGDWDLAFVNIDLNSPQPSINYTPPYLELEQTYLVRGNSPYRSVAHVDRPGVRVASFSPSAIEGYLKLNLKDATVLEVPSISHGVVAIEEGRADAYAASRAELVAGGWRLAEGRILDDSLTSFRWAVAVASGRADLLAYVTQFLESAKRNGVIKNAIERNKVAGARVSP